MGRGVSIYREIVIRQKINRKLSKVWYYMGMEKIDFNFDFTSDTKGFWEAYGKYLDQHMAGLDGAKGEPAEFVDPDAKSATLKKYHRAVWSKPLPNGKTLKLVEGSGNNLTCDVTVNKEKKKFRLASDIIVTSFLGYAGDAKYQAMFRKVRDTMLPANYRAYVAGYTRQFYRNLGAFIIFPVIGSRSINPTRGISPLLRDRFDLTLECIRLYYQRQADPTYAKDLLKNENFRSLYKALFNSKDNKDFFDLFGSFPAYVDYFCLQDWVSGDYSYVRDLTRADNAPVQFWLGSDGTLPDPIPTTAEGYLQWMANQLAVIEKRTKRIQAAIAKR